MKTSLRSLFYCCVGAMLHLCACSSSQPDIVLNASNPVIYFARTQCFGTCPSYKLTIKGDGTASYEGLANVERIGYYEATISKDDLLLLVGEFQKTRFFELLDEYDAPVTDVPTRTLSYTLNGKTKKIRDRFEAPEVLRDLERKIDEVADKLSWRKIRDAQE